MNTVTLVAVVLGVAVLGVLLWLDVARLRRKRDLRREALDRLKS